MTARWFFTQLIKLCFVCISPSLSHAEKLTLFTYHDKPPYYMDLKKDPPQVSGIYRDFVDYLNRHQRHLSVELKFQPRIRLEELLKRNRLMGAVIGVSPIWFGDKEKNKFLWSSPFMVDKDVIVTRRDDDFVYTNPRDLIGKKMALPRGLYFNGITELVGNNSISVYYTGADQQDFDMLLLARADATVASILTFNYFSRTLFTDGKLKASAIPHDEFQRQLLFPKYHNQAYERIEPVIAEAMADPEWQKILARYR